MSTLAVIAHSHRSPLITAIEKIADDDAFSRLQGEWDELLQTSAADNLFLTFEWLYTWWKHFGTRRRLSILALRSNQELVAIAPFWTERPILSRGQLLPTVQFLGSGSVGSDYLDVIVRRGFEDAALPALANCFSRKRRILRWTQLRRHDCSATRVAAAIAKSDWQVSESKTNVCPFIPLEGSSWDSYLASLGAEHRYTLRRKWRTLNRDFTVRFECVVSQEQCAAAMDAIFRLHNLRWVSRGGSNAFHTSPLKAFHREWASVALGRGWLRLYTLRLNERIAAALYGFLYRGKFYFYQTGFDPTFERYSVGLATMGFSIRSAIQEAAYEYDLLHGDEAYKSHWSRHTRELARLELYPPGVLGRICQSATELARRSRRAAKQLLGESYQR